ncbi:shikimate kinase [Sinomicrobium sp. M5D2P17]
MVIVLIGYMGSGKSAVGRSLAEKLSLKFVDMDDFIEEKEEKSIPEIFRDKGEIYFRKAESRYVEELFANARNTVVSLGGGTPCYGSNMEYIQGATDKVVYLRASIEELTARLEKEKEHRPLIKHLSESELEEFIRKHLFERNFFYLKANYSVKVDSRPVETIVDEIVSRVV